MIDWFHVCECVVLFVPSGCLKFCIACASHLCSRFSLICDAGLTSQCEKKSHVCVWSDTSLAARRVDRTHTFLIWRQATKSFTANLLQIKEWLKICALLFEPSGEEPARLNVFSTQMRLVKKFVHTVGCWCGCCDTFLVSVSNRNPNVLSQRQHKYYDKRCRKLFQMCNWNCAWILMSKWMTFNICQNCLLHIFSSVQRLAYIFSIFIVDSVRIKSDVSFLTSKLMKLPPSFVKKLRTMCEVDSSWRTRLIFFAFVHKFHKTENQIHSTCHFTGSVGERKERICWWASALRVKLSDHLLDKIFRLFFCEWMVLMIYGSWCFSEISFILDDASFIFVLIGRCEMWSGNMASPCLWNLFHCGILMFFGVLKTSISHGYFEPSIFRGSKDVREWTKFCLRCETVVARCTIPSDVCVK